jgi:hypothetical protein
LFASRSVRGGDDIYSIDSFSTQKYIYHLFVTEMIDKVKLRYRRQFLLCREPVPSLKDWTGCFLRDGLYLYVHPDLDCIVNENEQAKICLLGYLIDPKHIERGNAEILSDILAETKSFTSLLEKIKAYTGQFVFLYLDGQTLTAVHDALALREIYYCTSYNRVICGSQPNLLKEYSDPPLCITANNDILHFYAHDLQMQREGRLWVGDETYFDGIKHLLPNHYLDMMDLRPIRYWPREELTLLDLDEAVSRACAFLQGALKSMALRNDLMLAVTGGTDSRTLLAASREISHKLYYFINRHKGLIDNHPDIYIPSSIFKRIGVPFHVHDLDGDVDPDFREIFLGNTFLSSDKLLPAIYNVYYKQHSNRINVLGVGEIGRTFFGSEPNRIDGYYLARSMKIKYSPYAFNQCQKWLDAALPVSRRYGVNTMTLLLWEQLLGNWGAVGNSESDIAIEEIDPFNSHYLYETLLGVDKKYAKSGESVVFREMIRKMWPELLEYPINPPYEKRDYLQLILKKTKLFRPLKTFIYFMGWMKYRLKHGRL